MTQRKKSGKPKSTKSKSDHRKKGNNKAKSTPQSKSSLPLISGWWKATPDNDNHLKPFFWGAFGLIAVIAIVMALSTGFNEDEKFHHKYEKALWNTYSTFGQDKSALFVEKGSMHLYGGFFDLITGVTNRALGYDSPEQDGFHNIRHFYNALFGCVAILFCGLLASSIAGWRAGILALVFIFLTPRFLGHCMMNPRDIPFAAGYIMSLYFIVAFLREMPKPRWSIVLGLIGGIGMAIGARSGGLLLIAYLGLFAIIDFIVRYGIGGLAGQPKMTGAYLKFGSIAVFGGIFAALLVWPFGLSNPFSNILRSLTEFSNYSTNIRMLFGGKLVWSNDLPLFQYLFTWYGLTLPLFILLGLLVYLAFSRGIFKQYAIMPLSLALFGVVFPVSYILYKNSTLYDGLRHTLFIIPPLVATAAIGWNFVIKKFETTKTTAYLLWGILGLSALWPVYHLATNFKHAYVFFNPLAGGVRGTFGEFEHDYWGISMKQAVRWMEKEGFLSENLPEKIIVSSNFGYLLRNYTGKFGENVKPDYTRFRERYDKDWDYAIYVGRFIDPGQLSSGRWPSKKAIHVIESNGVPLAVVYKKPDENAHLTYKYAKQGDWENTILYGEQEVANYPDNDLAWMNLANAYSNTQQLDKAKQALDQVLDINPDNFEAWNLIANMYLRQNQIGQAKQAFLKSVDLFSNNYIAYYYLGLIEQQQNNLKAAIDYAKTAIQINPRFAQAYELAASAFEQSGDAQSARQYRAAINNIK